jgi:uncharacterized membrane protein
MRLFAIKLVHTVVWAFFAGCILAIPLASWLGHHGTAAALIAVVALEVVVLAFNKMSCPLTSVAARHTSDRRANFDIFLPEWLAQYNKLLFGSLYVLGIVFALVHWV